MTSVTRKLDDLQARVTAAARRFGRDPQSIHIIAVSKGHGAAAIREAYAAGLREFGENYVQEASGKADELADLPLVWHFIGRLQANKTRFVAERCDWCHTLERSSVAERLNAQRPFHAPPLQVCIQVEVAGDPSRSGVQVADLPSFAERVAALPRLRLRGLMCLPPIEQDFEGQRAHLRRLRECRDLLLRRGLELDVLSAGMSDDLEAAIAEGATHLRIGTAIFGPREPR
jgi:pyridoxal phosphate enzyme (YggS family)